MSKIKVAVTDTVFPDWKPAEEALSALDVELIRAKSPEQDAILAVASDADAVFVTYAQITADVIAGLNNCKVIGRFGIGTDNIAIDAATDAGIIVTYAPVYCLDEVSDHAMALLLSLARKIPFSTSMVSGGRWEMPAVVPIRRFKGRTLGLIGIGNIARGSDYPHPEGSWPRTAQALKETFKGIPPEELAPMLGENAAAWYGFDPEKLAPVVARVGPRKADFE